ncbi:hypothetical protein DK68_2863 [Brucella suis]|nr:hypothetical protein DK68_2863 [Brucella suis]
MGFIWSEWITPFRFRCVSKHASLLLFETPFSTAPQDEGKTAAWEYNAL